MFDYRQIVYLLDILPLGIIFGAKSGVFYDT